MADSNPSEIQTGRFACTYRSSIGIDVHNATLVCCYQSYDLQDDVIHQEERQFGTTSSQLKLFSAWCCGLQPDIVMMESTGVLWLSPYEALEKAGFKKTQLALVNARDVKGRKGHKSDKSDAQHLAELARLGAFRKSFVPAPLFRKARLIARTYIKAKQELSRAKNRYHKSLNFLGSRASQVFSDVRGKSASTILEAFVELAAEEPEEFERIVRSNSARLKANPEQILDALNPIGDNLTRKLLQAQQKDIEHKTKQCSLYLGLLETTLGKLKAQIKQLCKIPGIKRTSALLILAEIGDDLSDFPSEEKFCSWIGVCSGNKISAGKSYGASTPKGNKYLRMVLTEVCNGIALQTKGFLRRWFQVLKERRGRNRAIVALAHKLARIIFALFTKHEEYVEDQTEVLQQHRVKKLENSIWGVKQAGLEVCGEIKVVSPKIGTVFSTPTG